MRQGLRSLRLLQSEVHRPVQVIRQLRRLSRRDQGAHGDEAAVPRRQIGTLPEILEQHACGVLDDAWCDRAVLLADPLRTFGLRRLVERQQLHGRRRELIGANAALPEDIFRDAKDVRLVAARRTATRATSGRPRMTIAFAPADAPITADTGSA